MEDDKITIRRVSWFAPLWYLFIAGLGYFVYGNLAGAWAAFLLSFGLSLLLVLAIIPIFGIGLWLAAALWFKAQIFTIAGISTSIVTSFIWWTSSLLAGAIWIAILAVCLMRFAS